MALTLKDAKGGIVAVLVDESSTCASSSPARRTGSR